MAQFQGTNRHEVTKFLIMTVLWQQLSPQSLVVSNDSENHKGHREAERQPDKGHFIVSITFSDDVAKSRLAQHRMIYTALDGLMHRIHALSIHITVSS